MQLEKNQNLNLLPESRHSTSPLPIWPQAELSPAGTHHLLPTCPEPWRLPTQPLTFHWGWGRSLSLPVAFPCPQIPPFQ